MKSSLAEIEALLESDDELASDYYEEPATPAYQIDCRFYPIKFNWINNLNACKSDDDYTAKIKSASNDIKSYLNISYIKSKPVIKKGVLLKSDLFCLKSIEGFTGDSTLTWLINFLVLKDLQSRYVFLKSCLVGKLIIENTNDLSVNVPISDANKI